MAKTFAQIEKQIQTLRAQAEELRKREVGEVIGKIKSAIVVYGITVRDLFGPSGKASAKVSAGKTAATPKYRDAAGNAWSGRGPRPRWVKAAMAAGKSLDDLRADDAALADDVAPGASKPATAVRRKKAKKAGAKGAVKSVAQYADGTHSWTGRGPRPRWLKAAIADGKTLDELRVS